MKNYVIMNEKKEIVEEYFLSPGEIIVSRKPSLITTILGSCIAVCLFDSRKNIGGMNHFMLPAGEAHVENAYRFGVVAIPKIINMVEKHTGSCKNMVAKVYGGSDTFNSNYQIGKKNIDMALALLKEKSIKIEDIDVGGPISRKIKFNTYTNEVKLYYLE